MLYLFAFLIKTCQFGLDRVRRQINTANNSISDTRNNGLPRPLLCLGIAQTTTVFGDRLDHYCARGLTGPFPCSGNTPTTVTFPTITVLSKYYDHCRARGLSRPLFGVCSPRLHVIRTHIQSRDISLDLATRLIFRLPASSGTTSVRCTCRCILFCLCGNLVFN